MVPMIIKGLFRKYESWNPVHPTYGAFWGMGVGVGCGIGWGPGFGPEVIGYVGAGCGVGFSVGITFAGVGIGLPTSNFIFQLPYNALTATSGAMYFARSGGLLSIRNDTGNNAWDDAKVNRFSLKSFKHQQLLKKTADFHAMNTFMSTKTRLIFDCFDQLKSGFGHSR